MQSLKISKGDLMALSAIISKRTHPDESLLIQELPICWKISTINPITKQPSLVAYILKNTDHANPVLLRNDINSGHMAVDSAPVPTLSRHIHPVHSRKKTNPGNSDSNY